MSNINCAKCEKTFKSKVALDYHNKNNVCSKTNTGRKKKSHTCKHCGKGIASESGMYRHIRESCRIKNKNDKKAENVEERMKKLEIENRDNIEQLKTENKEHIEQLKNENKELKEMLTKFMNEMKGNIEMDFGEESNFEFKLSEVVRYNCIYLIYLSTIGEKGEKVYKFGKTYRSKKRFYAYPSNSTIIFITRVKDCHHVEDEIFKLFKKQFTHREDYGREYFETNNVRLMINYINRIIDTLDQRMDGDMVEYMKKSYKGNMLYDVRAENDVPDNFGDLLISRYT
jgi:hypothetical protein